jgi:hypothetical protein
VLTTNGWAHTAIHLFLPYLNSVIIDKYVSRVSEPMKSHNPLSFPTSDNSVQITSRSALVNVIIYQCEVHLYLDSFTTRETSIKLCCVKFNVRLYDRGGAGIAQSTTSE